MRIIGVREVKDNLSEHLEISQKETVIITRHGRPVSVILGVKGYDLEQVMLMADPEFWAEIQRRRADTRPGISVEEARRRLLEREAEETPLTEKEVA